MEDAAAEDRRAVSGAGALPSPGPWHGLEYDGLQVTVSADEPAAVAWLEEFLGPSFGRAPGAAAACRVALTSDEARYRDLLARGPLAPARTEDAFVLDERVLRFPRWAGPALTLHDAPAAVFYTRGDDGRWVRVLTRPGNLAARVAWMRVVRELAMAHALGRGALILHAAALAVGDRVLVLAGPTAAGKTTLLLHLLGTGRAAYLANDRVRVTLVGAGAALRARGMPTIVTLRPGTRALFPGLVARLAARPYHYRSGLAEAAGGPTPSLAPWPDGRLGVSPAHLADALDVDRVAEGEVAAVVFPTLTGAPGGLAVRELPAPETVARLERSLLGAGHWPRLATVFAPPGAGPPPDAAALRARCERLAASVRGFECRLGTEAYADGASAASVLALAGPPGRPGEGPGGVAGSGQPRRMW
jgi:hypothetical protein